MDQNQLTEPENFTGFKKFKRRRSMLPWWVIGFTWIFLAFGALMPVAIVFGLLRRTFPVSLLGLSADDPFSLVGIFIIILFAFKGFIAFGLWTEKSWAIDLAKIDAITSTVICCSVTVYSLIGPHSISIRLELVATIPYYIKMNNIEYDWKNFDEQEVVSFSVEQGQ